MSAPLILVVLAVLGATLAPRFLARSPWCERSPRLGIAAWQALSFAVIAAVVLAGAALALPAVPLSVNVAELLSACVTALRAQYATPGGAAVSATGALLAVTVLARTGYCLAAGLVATSRQRWRQVDALSLVARRHEPSGALLVDHSAALVYCLPGRHQQVVLTTGALAALDRDQLAAVLAHERAHLGGRHDLVLAAAAALLRAFPRIPVFQHAHRELARLVEMLADDVAARRNDRLTIATALVHLAEASAPATALGAGGSTSLARVRRLVAPAQPLGATRSVLAGLATAVLLSTPVAVVAFPAVLAATSGLCPIELPSQPLS